MMKATSIQSTEYAPFYKNYIDNSGTGELIESLANSGNALVNFFSEIPNDKLLYQYAPNKWTIKEILNHLLDSERVFCYRALCVARQDKVDLPGFNENDYVTQSNANSQDIATLINDYNLQRQSTIALFKSFSEQMLMSIGKANAGNISVRAIGFIIVGHERHHIKIIKERYLGDL